MILVEFKESVLNEAFEEIDEAKKNLESVNYVLCSLEDILGQIKGESKSDEYGEDDFDEEDFNNKSELGYWSATNMRNMKNMRNMRNMRNMKRVKYSGVHGFGRYSY